METTPVTPPYDHQEPTSFKQFTMDKTITSQPSSPPDLLHDHEEEEEEEDQLCTPSPKELFLVAKDQHHHHKSDTLIKPIQSFTTNNNKRRKTSPYKSPSILEDDDDNSVIFQLDQNYEKINSCDFISTPKVICGQSLLSLLRKRVNDARITQHDQSFNNNNKYSKKRRAVSIIDIPRHEEIEHISEEFSNKRNVYTSKLIYQHHNNNKTCYQPPPVHYDDDHHNTTTSPPSPPPVKRIKKASTSGRPSRVKGPCQACNEPSDGCMRKAFHWPFKSNQVFYDKGKPFVYLCNKCGLRYNKSGGLVCRHCRWVFCKEEKRKALQHIDMMRSKRPLGQPIDLDEEIENFVCNPKYWDCGRTWKVGWVLNEHHLEDEE